MDFIQSIIIAIVEGLTEFIPVSSTGHMIIAEKLLNVPDNGFTKVFTVAIQLGAILAVVVLYWKKFFDFKNWQFYLKLIAGVIPALILGFLFAKKLMHCWKAQPQLPLHFLWEALFYYLLINYLPVHAYNRRSRSLLSTHL